MFSSFWQRLDYLFPEPRLYARRLSPSILATYFLLLTVIFSLTGWILRPNGLIGFDWVNFFGVPRAPVFYPPWTVAVVRLLSWPSLIGITIASFITSVLLRSVHPLSGAAAVACMPLIWTLFLGQLEGIALFGVLGIPWLVPLALIKPQITVFAFLAKRQYILVLALFLLLSIVLWGLWPLSSLAIETYNQGGRYPQNIGVGWWGVPLALAALWISRGDIDLLMLAGCFLLPHLIPYNLLPVTPAVARLSPRQAWIAVGLSYLPLAANWVGPWGWWLGWIFHAWLWVQLLRKAYPERLNAIFRW